MFVPKRKFDPEIQEMMDLEQPYSAELDKDLENLRKLNAWFGSHRLIRYYAKQWLKQIPEGEMIQVLDLATGGGDIPRLLVDMARVVNREIRVRAIDFQQSTLEIARAASRQYPEIEYCLGDIREYDTEGHFHIVFCNLALHHFSEEDAVRILKRVRKLSSGYGLVSDLLRDWWGIVSVYFITATLFREEMTVHDARLSIRRAFSGEEFKKMGELAGWPPVQHDEFLFSRQALWFQPEEREDACEQRK